MWRCVLKATERKIQVYSNDNLKGEYLLLEKPYCEYCASPNTTTNDCALHDRCYGFKKAYAMGSYYPSKGDQTSRGWTDFLSNHIRGVKRYPNYGVPIGLGLTLCYKYLFPELQNTDLIVPIPKFPTELKIEEGTNRAYNQAMEIANTLSSLTKLTIADALIKVRAQKMRGLNEDERWAAVKGLFEANSAIEVAGRNILLLDDVFTSGATISECSDVLLQKGAQNVNVLVAGRDTFDNGV